MIEEEVKNPTVIRSYIRISMLKIIACSLGLITHIYLNCLYVNYCIPSPTTLLYKQGHPYGHKSRKHIDALIVILNAASSTTKHFITR